MVPSPVMATRRPAACSRRMRASLSSGLASAMKSSTPASRAMAAAVRGLSPVIMTVLMPMARNRSKRSFRPPLTISLRWMTPRTFDPSATRRGVPPWRATRLTASSTSRGKPAPTKSRTASGAPFRMRRPSKSTPLIRVRAEKAMKDAPGRSARDRPRRPYDFASTTMLRPSGVSSASEASWAALAISSTVMPGAGRNAAAWRSPSVIVPVLSRRRTPMSPAASTARPLMARTFFWTMRSMPAIPMALSSPPIVVGIRQTRRATSTVVVKVTPE